MLILASKSIRRKELLNQTGLEYKVVESLYDEDNNNLSKEDPKKYVETLSYNKAKEVLERNLDAVTIGADTIVVLGKEILEKPSDEDDAYKILKKLSGKTHEVLTSVTVMSKNKEKTFTCISEVKFKRLREIQIKEYIASGEPMDKAGAYAIQGIGNSLIKEYEGDLFNIIGLPLKELLKVLEKDFKIEINKK